MDDLTRILKLAAEGDRQASAEAVRLAYEDLRQLAASKMAGERQNHTLTATALVNEVSAKLIADAQLPSTNRAQFFAYASRAMRNLLIDWARANGRQRRGGDRRKFSFDEAIVASRTQSEDFLALNDALEALAKIEPRKAQVVEMRYFAGMSNEEIASALEISLATVKRDWNVAKVWLLRTLTDEDDVDASEA